MKSGRFAFTIIVILFSLSLFIMNGCSTDAISDPGGSDPEITISALDVIATPDTINPSETATVEAIAFNASGNVVSGAKVDFSIDDHTMAYITGTATTDNDGVAEVILTARGDSGEVIVTATSGGVSGDTMVTISSGPSPAAINVVSVTPASIIVQGTASVRAEVLDAAGDPIPDGTMVSFTATNTLYGTFSPATATTTNGFATATFTASNTPGTVSVTVQAGGVSAQSSITIFSAEAASIGFVSAEPQVIALAGSGGAETSTIQFMVKDSNGDPANGEPVSFVMTGPTGAYIDATPGDPTPGEIQVSTNPSGIAMVILHSGNVPGPATITATITVTDSGGNEKEISSKPSVVSIGGGGVPSAKRFSVAATVLNLPGLERNNVETSITAYLADRFGNYNILAGTTVSFITELGLAIDTSNVTLDEYGLATAVARTQAPIGSATVAEDVVEVPWETQLIDYIETAYGTTLPGHPRDGLCSVTVYVKGEEHFYDANGNGVYDSGETFIDTEDDPFMDYNDDGLRDDGAFDVFEEYIDSSGNGVWDGKNGKWDSDKYIFTNFKILLTGEPYLIKSSVPSPRIFSLEPGDNLHFTVIVCDRNGNWLTPDSTVSVSASEGTLSGDTSFTFPDTNSLGPLEIPLTLSAEPDATPSDVEITVDVTWQGSEDTLTESVVVARGAIVAPEE